MELHVLLLTLGGILFSGLIIDELGRRTQLPRVTLLILLGIAVGPSGFDLLPQAFQDGYKFLAATALTMVAFLLGGQLSLPILREHGRVILTVSLFAIFITALLVGFGLYLVGAALTTALLLAGISTATAPAATRDVIRQVKAKGPFTTTLLGVVAIDDAWGLIVFSVLLVLAKFISGTETDAVFLIGIIEIGGAVLIGILLGVPAIFLTGRLNPGEPIQLEALGLVFLCAGAAIWLEVSYLLAGMVCGAIITNFAKHHNRPFHEIENIEWPFMVMFFILAGALLDPGALLQIGVTGIAFILFRSLGRISGGWLGARFGGARPEHAKWLGMALMPQAGVALGMALVAEDHFPEYGSSILAITIGATVVFEIVGPAFTMLALRRVGEAGEDTIVAMKD